MLPRSGMYIYPFPPKMSDKQGQMNFKNSHEKGPRLRLSIKKEGAPAMPPSTFVKGLGLNFVIALLASTITAMASSSLPQFDRRFLFVSLISSASLPLGECWRRDLVVPFTRLLHGKYWV